MIVSYKKYVSPPSPRPNEEPDGGSSKHYGEPKPGFGFPGSAGDHDGILGHAVRITPATTSNRNDAFSFFAFINSIKPVPRHEKLVDPSPGVLGGAG